MVGRVPGLGADGAAAAARAAPRLPAASGRHPALAPPPHRLLPTSHTSRSRGGCNFTSFYQTCAFYGGQGVSPAGGVRSALSGRSPAALILSTGEAGRWFSLTCGL